MSQGIALGHDKFPAEIPEKCIHREILIESEIFVRVIKDRFWKVVEIGGSGWRVPAHGRTGLEQALPSRETGKLGELLERKLSRGSLRRRIEHRIEGGNGAESGSKGEEGRKKFETAARRKWVWVDRGIDLVGRNRSGGRVGQLCQMTLRRVHEDSADTSSIFEYEDVIKL